MIFSVVFHCSIMAGTSLMVHWRLFLPRADTSLFSICSLALHMCYPHLCRWCPAAFPYCLDLLSVSPYRVQCIKTLARDQPSLSSLYGACRKLWKEHVQLYPFLLFLLSLLTQVNTKNSRWSLSLSMHRCQVTVNYSRLKKHQDEKNKI